MTIYRIFEHPEACPIAFPKIMLHSILLLGFINLALELSNGDLKVSGKLFQANVDSNKDIAVSSIITNPTERDIRIFEKNCVLGASTRS